MTSIPVTLDGWVMDLLVDPLSKQPLMLSPAQDYLLASYGRKYPIVDGIFDLRLLNNQTTHDQKVWNEGQRFFEKILGRMVERDHSMDYVAEREDVRGVYDDIPIEGDCLDVGGHQGRLRAFLQPEQKYVACDPFLNGLEDIDRQPNLLKAYPFLLDRMNFVCCDAEFLPFEACSFQTVHMRSVIDHLLNSELALNEAYRVLKPGGILLVGLYVTGGKRGKVPLKRRIRELIRETLVFCGFKKLRDHHVWHPTYEELTRLVTDCGFDVAKVHWQKAEHDMVCYLKCVKCDGLTARRS